MAKVAKRTKAIIKNSFMSKIHQNQFVQAVKYKIISQNQKIIMGAEESLCSEPVNQVQIPTSIDDGLENNLKLYHDHIPSRNYARRVFHRPNLNQRVQSTIKNLLDSEPLKTSHNKGFQLPCFLILKKKVYYFGQWLNGLPHGKGSAYFQNGSFFQGFFNQGEAQGEDNIFIHPDGSYYRGAFRNSKKNGSGNFYFHNGYQYSGSWLDDKPNGKNGIQNYPDGSKYIGGFLNGLKEWQGQYFWPDGKVYVGQFKNGYMDGKGILKKGKDSYFQGQFVMNKKQGKGVLKLPFGVYQGGFVDGLMSGQGTFKWNDGRVYQGNFSDGKLNGKGNLILTNGNIIVGQWQNGQNIEVLEIKNNKNK